MTYITSRSNEKIRDVVFLKERKEREARRLFFFEGAHLLEEYLRSGNVPRALFVSGDAAEKYAELIGRAEALMTAGTVYCVPEHVYGKMTCEQAPQGILCVSGYTGNVRENGGEALAPGSVVLESVRDPGNLGGMLRTAASLGISGVTVSRDCADIFSPKTVRASMGAVFFEEITVCDSVAEVVKLTVSGGTRVYAACLYGETVKLGSFAVNAGDCFVLGNEGQGVSGETAEACSSRVIIPMSGLTESMNVAAASAVIMWEMVKSRG